MRRCRGGGSSLQPLGRQIGQAQVMRGGTETNASSPRSIPPLPAMADDNKPVEKGDQEEQGRALLSAGFCLGVRRVAAVKGRQQGRNQGAWEQGTPFPPVLQRWWGEAVCLTLGLKGEVLTAGWPHPAQPQWLSPRAALTLPCLDTA